MTEDVTLSITNHVAEVTLNRPKKYNALSPEVFEGLTRHAKTISQDPSIRAVVLSGAGGNFSAGIDLDSLKGSLSDNESFRRQALNLQSGEIANVFQKAAFAWKELRMPVIAAIEGVCFGGGLQIALGADIRLAGEGAKLSVMEVKWGLIPDMALSTVLPRLMPMDVAKTLLWSGRIVDSIEAERLNLITWACDNPLDAARELADDLATKSPEAVQGIKALLENTWTASPEVALRTEAEIQSRIIGMPNQLEAVQANMEKRAPSFKDPDLDAV